MSYSKIKSIKVDEKEGKVFINSACSNVRPLTYSVFECESLGKILREKGRVCLDIEILREYETGNLQNGNNKYVKAFKVLIYVFKEEYKRFDWRLTSSGFGSKEMLEHYELRKSEEFDKLLKKCLNYKFPKDKFVISQISSYSGDKFYAKVNKTCVSWVVFKEKATKFDFEEEARNNIYERFKDKWEVEKYDI